MNFSPYKISENFVLGKLKNIKDGYLILENYDGKIYQFGNKENILNAKIKIHNPRFYLNIIRDGSTALAESYIRNEFETSNLPSLIELTAKNINITHKFSGILNISTINSFFKKLFISNTKKKSVEEFYLLLMEVSMSLIW